MKTINSTLPKTIVTAFITGLLPLAVNAQNHHKSLIHPQQSKAESSRVFQVGDTMVKEVGKEELEASESYWTPERLREAKPLPFRHGKGQAFPPGVLKTTPTGPPITISPKRGSELPAPQSFGLSSNFSLSLENEIEFVASFEDLKLSEILFAGSFSSSDQPPFF